MEINLQGVSIAILGGDKREIELIKVLIKLGAKLKVVGNPTPGEKLNLEIVDSLQEAVLGAQVIIAPMTGTDETSKIKATFSPQPLILTEEVVSRIPPKTPFLIGLARDSLKKLAKKYKIKLIEMAELDEIAILNAIPTAEGAIQIAMESLPITIHGTRTLVLGFGRVGITLARMLHGIGAKTIVVSRKPGELARAKEMGLEQISLESLGEKIADAQLIFNTVPSVVLTGEVLKNANLEALIIDLASPPGGTDFAAAKDLGLQVILAPGLPGKVAPKTAGQILGDIVPKIIRSNLKLKK